MLFGCDWTDLNKVSAICNSSSLTFLHVSTTQKDWQTRMLVSTQCSGLLGRVKQDKENAGFITVHFWFHNLFVMLCLICMTQIFADKKAESWWEFVAKVANSLQRCGTASESLHQKKQLNTSRPYLAASGSNPIPCHIHTNTHRYTHPHIALRRLGVYSWGMCLCSRIMCTSYHTH